MLDGTALQTAASRIADVRIGDAEERTGNQVMVPVEYTVDGSRLRTEFLLERTGTQWLFFPTWAFVPSRLPTIDVTVINAAQATVNGVPRRIRAKHVKTQHRQAFAPVIFDKGRF
jgi:hypothetical protein